LVLSFDPQAVDAAASKTIEIRTTCFIIAPFGVWIVAPLDNLGAGETCTLRDGSKDVNVRSQLAHEPARQSAACPSAQTRGDLDVQRLGGDGAARWSVIGLRATREWRAGHVPGGDGFACRAPSPRVLSPLAEARVTDRALQDRPNPTRVLLLETMSDELHRHHGAEAFPYLLPLLRSQGCDVAWWTVLVPRALTHLGARFTVDVTAETRARLVAAIRAWQPHRIVCHNRLAEPLERALVDAAPDARMVDDTEHVGTDVTRRTVQEALALLLGAADVGGDQKLYDAVMPVFERMLFDPEGLRAAGQPLRVIEERACLYRRALAGNPAYARTPSQQTRDHVGCAFCEKAAGYLGAQQNGTGLLTPPLELTLRQLAAYQRSPRDARTTDEVLVESGAIAADLRTFLAEVLARGLEPTTFYFMPRIDEFVGQAARIEALLPRLRDAGHRVGLLSTGLENFSPRENERFNKGISAEQIWACVAVIQRLEQTYPTAFVAESGFFAGILFTPWTTPEDLRINLEAARKLGSAWLSRVVGVRLQLRPGTPIAELAQVDGLTLAASEQSDVASEALTRPGESELAWRFADPRTKTLQRLLVRLDPLPQQSIMSPDDALLATVRQWRAQLPPELASDHVGVALRIVEAGAQLAAHASPEDVLRHASPPLTARRRAARLQATHGLSPALLRALARLQRLRPESLGGYVLVARTAAQVHGAPCLQLAFDKQGRILRLVIASRRPGQAAWLQGERVSVAHDLDTPPAQPADLRLARFLLALFDAV